MAMGLSDWLTKTRRSPAWLAEQLASRGHDVTLRTIQRWLSGASKPRSTAVMLEIVSITRGKVTIEDIVTQAEIKRPPWRPKRNQGHSR